MTDNDSCQTHVEQGKDQNKKIPGKGSSPFHFVLQNGCKFGECVGSVLSDMLLAIDVNLKLEKEPGKSDRVCRTCACKTRITAEHIAFIRSHLAEDTSSHENPPSQILLKSPVTTTSPRREKISLPTTITPVRAVARRTQLLRLFLLTLQTQIQTAKFVCQ